MSITYSALLLVNSFPTIQLDLAGALLPSRTVLGEVLVRLSSPGSCELEATACLRFQNQRFRLALLLFASEWLLQIPF